MILFDDDHAMLGHFIDVSLGYKMYYQGGQGRERGKVKSEGKVACTFILLYVYFLSPK
jgi:hypothetical protein